MDVNASLNNFLDVEVFLASFIRASARARQWSWSGFRNE